MTNRCYSKKKYWLNRDSLFNKKELRAIITVWLPVKDINELEDRVEAGEFFSRSEAVRYILHRYLEQVRKVDS